MSWLKVLPLFAIIGIAACQPLPQPFQPEVKGRTASPLVRPIGETSLFIPPVAGLPAPQDAALSDALAEALAEREVPASDRARSVLSSVLTVSLERRGVDTVWRWSKIAPDNTAQEGGEQSLGIAPDRLAAGDPAVIKQAAVSMANAISAKLNEAVGNDFAEAAPAKLSLLECDGAPGDGNRSLRQALREILILAGIPPVPDKDSADYLIACQVRVWSDTPDSERVAIEWALLTADGRRLGEVKQANRIPRGQLSQAWGNTAHIIAQGGWQGLSRIIEAQRRPGLRAAPPRS